MLNALANVQAELTLILACDYADINMILSDITLRYLYEMTLVVEFMLLCSE